MLQWIAQAGCLGQYLQKIVRHKILPGHKIDEYSPIQTEISDCVLYLALENSYCSDYVTEKFYNALKAGAIPIANGWRPAYDEFLPGSYIHVDDFSSVEKLAEYLQHLLLSPDKQLQYHTWRLQNEVYVGNLQWNCQLCDKLQQHRQRELMGFKDTYVIPNLFDHLTSLQTCKNVNKN